MYKFCAISKPHWTPLKDNTFIIIIISLQFALIIKRCSYLQYSVRLTPSSRNSCVNGRVVMIMSGLTCKKESRDPFRILHRFRQIRGPHILLFALDRAIAVGPSKVWIRVPRRSYNFFFFLIFNKIVWLYDCMLIKY